MKFLFFFAGAAIGAVQFYLLSVISDAVLKAGKSLPRVAGAIIGKLSLYTLSILCVVLLFRKFVIPFSAGLGAGLVIFAAVNLIIKCAAKKR